MSIQGVLAPRVSSLLNMRRRDDTRHVILHYHIFKNAGTSFDTALHRSFGDTWAPFDRPVESPAPIPTSELTRFLSDNPQVKAFSSHAARWPEPSGPDLRIYPIVFLRNPIDRVGSIYSQYHRIGDRNATTRSFGEYVDWVLETPHLFEHTDLTLFVASSFQTLFLSDDDRIVQPAGAPIPFVTEGHLASASKRLHSLPVFGLVERYHESLAWIQASLGPVFPELDLKPFRENAANDRAPSIERRISEIREALGQQRYERLLRINEADLELYEQAVDLFAARTAGIPALRP